MRAALILLLSSLALLLSSSQSVCAGFIAEPDWALPNSRQLLAGPSSESLPEAPSPQQLLLQDSELLLWSDGQPGAMGSSSSDGPSGASQVAIPSTEEPLFSQSLVSTRADDVYARARWRANRLFRPPRTRC